MRLFNRGKKEEDTKCNVCGTELYNPERLRRHMKKAHGNVPEKKMDSKSGSVDGSGIW